jgi:hypothetical protein
MATQIDEIRLAALAALGLSEGASSQDVVRAYRRLAKLTHPDVAGSTDRAAGDRFTAITDAYHLLAAADPAPPAAAPPTPRSDPAPANWSPRPPIVARPVRVTPFPDRPKRPT